MGGPRSKASESDLREAWDSGEPFKAVAARIGMSPNTLRSRWKEMFGEEAFTERGKRLQATAAAETARAISTTRVYSDVDVPCSACSTSVTLKSNQVAHLDRSLFKCEQCSGDRDCPVCGQRVDGERGLSGHFRHRREAGDREHGAYELGEMDALWAGKSEPYDYVTCRECGLRSSNLASHVRVHSLTAEQYRTKHVGARVRSEHEQEVLNRGVAQSHLDGKHEGTKRVVCPDCDVEWDAPKSLAVTVHDTRCSVCKDVSARAGEEARWEGKSEPADYVTCRVCGTYRGQNLTSHFQSAHPEVVGQYGVQYPGALVNTMKSGSRIGGSVRFINLTPTDLAPYMDKQGRVEVAKAADGLGCSWLTVLNRCRDHKIPTRNRLAFQKRVLDLVSEALGTPYIWEWSHTDIVNPRTGYRLYFDGLFATHSLIVEAQGKQHYEYIPYWHKTEAEFRARREVDAHKIREAVARGYRVLEVRYDEPFTNPAYLAGRLVQMGVMTPGQVPHLEPGGTVLDLFG